jgi:hypothetical protein
VLILIDCFVKFLSAVPLSLPDASKPVVTRVFVPQASPKISSSTVGLCVFPLICANKRLSAVTSPQHFISIQGGCWNADIDETLCQWRLPISRRIRRALLSVFYLSQSRSTRTPRACSISMPIRAHFCECSKRRRRARSRVKIFRTSVKFATSAKLVPELSTLLEVFKIKVGFVGECPSQTCRRNPLRPVLHDQWNDDVEHQRCRVQHLSGFYISLSVGAATLHEPWE